MRSPRPLARVIRPLLPRASRPRTILRGPLRGCRIVASWHDYPAALLGYTEAGLLRWLSQTVKSEETWIDVGAHYGYVALALARLVGPHGRVFAFEPVSSTTRCLSETGRINHLEQLHVLELGLSDSTEREDVVIRLERGMAMATCEDSRAAGKIPVVSLDRIWPSVAGHNETVHGVKIDVQGMELRVLTGMQRVLEQHQPRLAVEFHPGVDRGAILDLLSKLGYRQPGTALEPMPDESYPRYADDRIYVFAAATERGSHYT